MKCFFYWDIKSDNIFLIILYIGFYFMFIDFGKFIEVFEVVFKIKCLNVYEQDEYCKKYRYIVFEIIFG